MDNDSLVLVETQLSTENIYSGKVVDFTLDKVRLPDDNIVNREVIKVKEAVAILAITPGNRIILVEQFRYPTGKVLLEIPAGKIENEDVANAALRELAEETRYTGDIVEYITKFYPTPGFCNEVIHLVKIKCTGRTNDYKPDDDEFINVKEFFINDIYDLMDNNEIEDAKTLIALSHLKDEDSKNVIKELNRFIKENITIK